MQQVQAVGVHVTILMISFGSNCRILDYLSGHSSYRNVFTVSFQSDRCYMGGVSTEPSCPRCDNGIEIVELCFFECQYCQRVWQAFSLGLIFLEEIPCFLGIGSNNRLRRFGIMKLLFNPLLFFGPFGVREIVVFKGMNMTQVQANLLAQGLISNVT